MRFYAQIKQQHFGWLLRSNRQCWFRNDHHTIALFCVLAINADRSARNLYPRVARRIHRTLDLLIRVQYRSKQAHVLIQLHRIITTIVRGDQPQLPASLFFGESLLFVTGC